MEKQFTINLNDIIIDLMVIESELLPEYLKTLTSQEILRYQSIQHAGKKLEFAASRFLKHQLFGNVEIEYLVHGSPFISMNNTPILLSISHSNHLTAICKNDAFPVAVDLELVSEKSVRLAPKFCSAQEAELFQMDSPEDMTLLWSFKETLYKLSDRNGLIFKKDIIVTKNGNNYVGEVLTSDGKLVVDLSFTKVEELYLTCNHTFKLLHASNQ